MLSEHESEDGAEVAKIRLMERGFSAVRRRREKDEGGRFAVELWQEAEPSLPPLAATTSRVRRSGSLSRKRSTPVLNESTNQAGPSSSSLSGKFARMRRGKSISGAALLLEQQQEEEQSTTSSKSRDMVYPTLFFAPSEQMAVLWVEALTVALAADSSFVHVAPSTGLTPSASLPVGLSSLSLAPGGPLASSRRLPSASAFPLPQGFNPDRRPSWLDRPPPPQANYRDSPEPSSLTSSTRSRSGSDVPAWLAANLAAHEPSTPTTPRQASALKSRRSMSFLPSNTVPAPASAAMDRSASDGRRSMEGGGRRLLGLIGRRSSKKDDAALDLGSYRMPSPTPSSSASTSRHPRLYSNTSSAKSSTSLADSLLSESHSTSNSSDRPATPLDSPIPTYTTTPATPRPKSPFAPSGAGQTTPKSFGDTLVESQGRRPPSRGVGSTPPVSLYGSRKSVADLQQLSAGRRKSSGRSRTPAEAAEESTASTSTNEGSDVFVDARTSLSSQRESSSGSGGLEHIVNPAELILQMRSERRGQQDGQFASRLPPRAPGMIGGLAHSFSTSHLSPSSAGSGFSFGGLSPPPRSMSSRQNLAGLAMGAGAGKSPSKSSVTSSSPARSERRRVVRKLSFGAVEE